MKILPDENIDVRFTNLFDNAYDVYTAKDMNWLGIKNGELLKNMEEKEF